MGKATVQGSRDMLGFKVTLGDLSVLSVHL